MNYTAIGDVVNVTARLQKLDKYYQARMIISEAVKVKIEGHCLVRPLDDTMVKGKKDKIKIFELMGVLQPEEGIEQVVTAKEKDLALRFTQGYSAYMQNDQQAAKAIFEKLLMDFPEDGPTQLYLSRLSPGR